MSSAALKKEAILEDVNITETTQDAESVGQLLRQTRESSKQSIESVAQTLRISQNYIEALEAEQTQNLPELVYTIGFLKTYAIHLGLDGDALVKQYKSQFIKVHKAETLDFPVPQPERHLPNRWLMVIATALACLIAVAWIYLQPWDTQAPVDEIITPEIALEQGLGLSREVTPVEHDAYELSQDENEFVPVEEGPTPITLPAEVSPVFPVSDVRSLKETKAADLYFEGKKIYFGPGDSVVLMASQPAWVEIKANDGTTILSQTLKAGQSKEIQTQEGLILSTGNAGGLSFYINNRYYSPLGKIGEVMTGYEMVFSARPAEIS